MRQHRSHDAGHDSCTSGSGSAHGPAPGKRTRSEQLAPVQQREREGGAADAVDQAAPAAAGDYLLYPEPPAANDEHRPPVSFVDSLLSASAPGAGMGAGAVQRAATANGSDAGPGDVHAAAAAGIAGPAGALPFADVIQRSFGAHDLSAIQAHVGGPAAAASAAMGAEAYATGQHVAFARPPDLHTAAHEAAHVVQQRAGVQLKGGVGEVGDAYEQQADAVADAVVRGESAEHLLVGPVGGHGGRVVQRREGGGTVPAPSADRFAPRSPERDAPRRLDELERTTARMREALPRFMTPNGRGQLQRLATQGRALRDALADMERAGLLRAQGLEDRFVEVRTHFENLDARVSPGDTPLVEQQDDRPAGTGTGIPLLDERPLCERPEHEGDVGCSAYRLTPNDRSRLATLLASRVGLAHTNFVNAVTLKQVEAMTRSVSNWGFMAELVFGVASLAVGAGLIAMAKRFTALPKPGLPGVDPSSMVTIEAMPADGIDKDHVLLGWKQISAGIRNRVRSAVNGPTGDPGGRRAFLQSLKASAGQMSQTISEQALVALNDQEAVGLYHAYHIDHHQEDAYANRIEELLARLEAQKIDDIGKDLEHDFGQREVVQLKYRGRLRRAMVAKDDAQPVDWARRPPRFISWVDAAFGEYADQVQRARAGDVEVVELDPWSPMAKSPTSPFDRGISDEVRAWMRDVDTERR